MYEIDSLGIFVGTGECNGHCTHCAGVPLRKYAPKVDGLIDEKLIEKTIIDCYKKGAKSLTLSSSGEPTLSPISVTKVLRLTFKMKKERNIEFSRINLYTNGIRIGEEKAFCDKYLPLWKKLGLTHIYITVHNIEEKLNAKMYGIEKYPSLRLIIKRLHKAKLLARANIVLSKLTIKDFETFKKTAEYLFVIGIDSISAWPIRGLDDKQDLNLSTSDEELDKMQYWIIKNNLNVRLLRESNRKVYKTGKKLTLFPNEVLSSSWCN